MQEVLLTAVGKWEHSLCLCKFQRTNRTGITSRPDRTRILYVGVTVEFFSRVLVHLTIVLGIHTLNDEHDYFNNFNQFLSGFKL